MESAGPELSGAELERNCGSFKLLARLVRALRRYCVSFEINVAKATSSNLRGENAFAEVGNGSNLVDRRVDRVAVDDPFMTTLFHLVPGPGP